MNQVETVIARIRERQQRVVTNHPRIDPDVRGRLLMEITIDEAVILADALETPEAIQDALHCCLMSEGEGI